MKKQSNTNQERALDRNNIDGILHALKEIDKSVGEIPHLTACHIIAQIEFIRPEILDCLPGGYAGECEACGLSIGENEVREFDGEYYLCTHCSPASPTQGVT